MTDGFLYAMRDAVARLYHADKSRGIVVGYTHRDGRPLYSQAEARCNDVLYYPLDALPVAEQDLITSVVNGEGDGYSLVSLVTDAGRGRAGLELVTRYVSGTALYTRLKRLDDTEDIRAAVDDLPRLLSKTGKRLDSMV